MRIRRLGYTQVERPAETFVALAAERSVPAHVIQAGGDVDLARPLAPSS
jgi:hypothetical protein